MKVAFFLMASAMFLLCNTACKAQNNFRFHRFSVKDGLAFQDSRGIQQDQHGFIWISHLDGLTRFDGYEFKEYKYDPDDSSRNKLNILIGLLPQPPSGNILINPHCSYPLISNCG